MSLSEVFDIVRILVVAYVHDIHHELSSLVSDEIEVIICRYYQLINVIIQQGVETMKVGLYNEDSPKSIFPVVTGRHKYPGGYIGFEMGFPEIYIGHEAIKRRGTYSNLKYPIDSNGFVSNWDDIELIWNHAFKNELQIEPADSNVLITEKPLNSKSNREKMIQIMFEKFNVNGVYIENEAVLSLYAKGKYTGTSVHCSATSCYITPVYEGYALQHVTTRMDFGGRDMTHYLAKLFGETKGYSFTTTAELIEVKDIQNKLCYVAEDFEEENRKITNYDKSFMDWGIEKKYELLDGYIMTADVERFQAPEILFEPHRIGKETDGIHEVIYRNIMDCDEDLRSDLFGNIVLSGGVCSLPGIDKRIKKEVTKLAPVRMDVKIVNENSDRTTRHILPWIGASIMSQQSSFLGLMIKKSEYNEFGPGIVHRKCF